MPLYDVVVMLKASVARKEAVDLVRSVGNKVLTDGGVICDIKAYGALQLAYEIKKLDGWHQEVRIVFRERRDPRRSAAMSKAELLSHNPKCVASFQALGFWSHESEN